MLRREPSEIEGSLRQIPEVRSQDMVLQSHRRVGQLISSHEGSALLLDVLLRGCPVVGASTGFEGLTQRRCEEVLGQGWRVLLAGLEEARIPRSAGQDVDDFLRMARLQHLDAMADCIAVMAIGRADGSAFTSHCTLRLVQVPEEQGRHPYILALQTDLDALGEAQRRGAYEADCRRLGDLAELLGAGARQLWPDASFFPSPLSFKCVLLNNVSSGMRREPHQVPRGCVLMSASSIELKDGAASFQVTVERTLPSWASRLPFLGFTCTTTEQVQDERCFFGPSPHAFCLGESATIGGSGEGWLRPESGSLQPILGQRLDEGALRHHLTPEVPEHRRRAPVTLQAGDVLGCCYKELPPLPNGKGDEDKAACLGPTALRSSIALKLNGRPAFEFEFEGRLPRKPMYTVVDVCYSVYQVSMAGVGDAADADATNAGDIARAIGG